MRDMKLLALTEAEHGLVKAVTSALAVADSGAGPTAAIARTILTKIEHAGELALEHFVEQHDPAILHLQLSTQGGMTPDPTPEAGAPASAPAEQQPATGTDAPPAGDEPATSDPAPTSPTVV